MSPHLYGRVGNISSSTPPRWAKMTWANSSSSAASAANTEPIYIQMASGVGAIWTATGSPVQGSVTAGWDYCFCYRTKTEVEKAAESKRYFDLERDGA